MATVEKEYDSPSLPSLIEADQCFDDSLYKYRDFTSVNEDELELEAGPDSPSPPPACGSRSNSESSIRVQKFPVKLYAILAQKEFHDIITWMPHGRSWKVLKPSLFESLVMPLFFEYSNYHSFNRLVNAWSFRRICSGADRGSYYHELFLRGKPNLQKYMRRLPKTHKKLPMKKEDEPDFYEMDKANPLPPLDEGQQMLNGAGDSSFMRGSGAGMMNTQISPMGANNQISPIGVGSGMGGMSAFEQRDPLLGMMGQHRAQGNGTMGMNGMTSIGSMNGMNMNAMSSMGQMNAMGSVNGMGLNTMNQFNTMNGINSLLDSSGFGEGSNGNSMSPGGDMDYQRLRQLQQMQLFERQMNSASAGMSGVGNESLPMNFMLRAAAGQHC